MLRYKFNVLQALKDAGYNATRIKNENIFGQRTIQEFRKGRICSGLTLDRLCELLDLQPGDIIEYVKDE